MILSSPVISLILSYSFKIYEKVQLQSIVEIATIMAFSYHIIGHKTVFGRCFISQIRVEVGKF